MAFEMGRVSCTSISIFLTPEIENLRDELAKVAVLSLVEGFANEPSILEEAPSFINRTLAGPLTPLNGCSYLVPLTSRKEVREVCKLGTFKVATKDGPCTLKITPWSAEIGAISRASGSSQWIHLWNLPLHHWSWCTITEVIKPMGEIVALSQASSTHKQFLSVLVHCRAGVSLPFELDLSMGMRRYTLLVTGEKGVIMSFRRDHGRYVLQVSGDGADQRNERRCIHEIPASEKGKQPVESTGGKNEKPPERSTVSGLVEQGSRPGALNGGSWSEVATGIDTATTVVVVERSSHDDGLSGDVPLPLHTEDGMSKGGG